MKFMALDLAASTGFAVGEAGGMPTRSGSVRMRRPSESFDVAVRNLGCFIRDIMVMESLGAIIVEDFLDPSVLNQSRPGAENASQKRSPEAIIAQIKMHGCVIGLAGVYGIEVHSERAATIRKHFTGRATAAAPSKGPKSSRDRELMRRANKQMVIDRAAMLGYVPRDCRDDNHADACALYDYSSAVLFRKPINNFKMFGAR